MTTSSVQSRIALVPLYAYQKRWIEDQSPRKAAKWCRSAGKTWGVMLEAVIDCHEVEADGRRTDWFVFSGAEAQTKEMVRTAAMHAQAFAIAVAHFDEELVVEGEKYTLHVVEFAGGSRIVGLPTNINTIRGRHGNLIWDEAGRTENDDELWRAAAPIANRKGMKIRLVGTCGAKRGPFFRIFVGEMAGWSLHSVDVHQAVADGAEIDLERAKNDADSLSWMTEYLMEFEDVASRLLSIEQILACEDDSALLLSYLRLSAKSKPSWAPLLDAAFEAPPSEGYDDPKAWARLFAPLKGRSLYAGYDVARKRHLAVLWVEERVGSARLARAVIALEARRFAEQEAMLRAVVPLLRRLCIDASGLGAQLGEALVEAFGEHQVEAVNFTEEVKEDLAIRVLRSFEDQANRLPREKDVRESLHSVYKMTTSANKVRFDSKSTDAGGHADFFWAKGLCEMAASSGAGDLSQVQSFGGRAWSRPAARRLG